MFRIFAVQLARKSDNAGTKVAKSRPVAGRRRLEALEPRLLLTHFRYGELAWEPIAAAPPSIVAAPNAVAVSAAAAVVSNTVEFHYQQAWRRTFYPGPPNVGDIVDTGTALDFGDGSSEPINLRVLSINPNEDWFLGEAVKADGTEGIVHTYASTGNFDVFMESGDRISTLQNNPDGSFRNETIVNVGSGNASPIASLSPIVQVADNSVVHFAIPAIDPNSDTLTYRLATSDEAGGARGFVQPAGFEINATTGIVTWDITDASAPNVAIDQLWTAQVIVEDRDALGAIKSKVPVDFLMKVVSTVSASPVFDSIPSDTLTAVAGQPLNFTVQAHDPDVDDTVSLQALNPPQGMTFAATAVLPGSAGNAVAQQASWTPSAGDIGSSFVITFQATDNTGLTTPATVIVTVTDQPQPTELVASIDVVPGSPANKVDLRSKGTVIVNVLSTEQFDPTQVNKSDLSALHFGDATLTARVSPTSATLRDVNCDGIQDLVLCFSIEAIARAGTPVTGSTQTELTGIMQDGNTFRGADSVMIVSSCPTVTNRCTPSCDPGRPTQGGTKPTTRPCTPDRTPTTPASTHNSSSKHKAAATCKPAASSKPAAAKQTAHSAAKAQTAAAHDNVFEKLGAQKQTARAVASAKSTKTAGRRHH